MLELLLKLIDRCIDLSKRHEENKKAIYSNFVAPIMSDFEALHKDYLESFRKYRQALAEDQKTLALNNPIFSEIATDSLFSANLRIKVSNLNPVVGISQRAAQDRDIREFINCLSDYLTCATANPLEQTVDIQTYRINRLGMANYFRSSLSTGLTAILKSEGTEAEKKEAALLLLDKIVGQLQTGYSNVVGQHATLKDKLLKPL